MSVAAPAPATVPVRWPITWWRSVIVVVPSAARSSTARTYTVRAVLQLPGVKTTSTDAAQVIPSSETSTERERIRSLNGEPSGAATVTTTSVVGARVSLIV